MGFLGLQVDDGATWRFTSTQHQEGVQQHRQHQQHQVLCMRSSLLFSRFSCRRGGRGRRLREEVRPFKREQEGQKTLRLPLPEHRTAWPDP